MSRIIACFNMTLDGNCDHTAVDPDAEVHDHYTNLLDNAGVLLYGRKTFELMKFWQNLLIHPSEQSSLNDFARSIDSIPKIVFSNTLQSTDWNTAALSQSSLADKVKELKQDTSTKDVLIGSRSLIIQLLNLQLLDEFQLCIHPVIAGKPFPLFDGTERSVKLHLIRTKQLNSGAIILYYQPEYSQQ